MRLTLLRVLAAPLPARTAAGPPAPPEPGMLAVLDQVEGDRLRRFGIPLDRQFLVLDLDLARQTLIIGAGARDRVRTGAKVGTPEGCIAVVDAVAEHLSRARLLTARGVQLPVEIEPPPGGLPAGLTEFLGVAKGTGDRTVLSDSHLPGLFHEGQEVRALHGDAGRGPLLGWLSRGGAFPPLDLAARPGRESRVVVEGAQRGSAAPDLFEDLPLRVVLFGGGEGHGALIDGPRIADLLPGMAVKSGKRYLGRIVATSPWAALVARPVDRGVETSVEVRLEGGGGAQAVIRGTGRGAKLAAWQGPAPAPGPVILLTRSGQEMVPPDLLIGAGAWDGRELRLPGSEAWPDVVEAARFRHGEERRRLRELR